MPRIWADNEGKEFLQVRRDLRTHLSRAWSILTIILNSALLPLPSLPGPVHTADYQETGPADPGSETSSTDTR